MTPKIQEALDQLIQAIQEETVARFSAMLAGDDGPIPIPYRGGRGTLVVPKARPKGGKRTPEELAGFKKTIAALVKRKPGLRTEEIGKELGVSTKELQLPMLQLRDDKTVKMRGVRRAARYFPV